MERKTKHFKTPVQQVPFSGYEIRIDGTYTLYPLVLGFKSQNREIELFLSGSKTARFIHVDGKFLFAPTAKVVSTLEELKSEIEKFMNGGENAG